MQWLFNLLYPIIDKAYGYHALGNSSDWDFGTGDFSFGTDWQVWDFDTVVGSDTVAVHICINVRNTVGFQQFRIRQKGQTGVYRITGGRTGLANQQCRFDLIIPLDSEQLCEYNFAGATWNLVQVGVVGAFVSRKS